MLFAPGDGIANMAICSLVGIANVAINIWVGIANVAMYTMYIVWYRESARVSVANNAICTRAHIRYLRLSNVVNIMKGSILT